MSTNVKRIRLWVDTPFQMRLVGRVGLYFLVFSLTTFHLAFALNTLLHIAGNGVDKNFIDFYLGYIYQQRALLITFILVTPIFLYDLVKFSHRVAGPLFRCRRLMEEMAQGKPVPEFMPRRRDLLRDFFASFNRLIREWNKRRASAATPVGNGYANVDQFDTAQPREERGTPQVIDQKV